MPASGRRPAGARQRPGLEEVDRQVRRRLAAHVAAGRRRGRRRGHQHRQAAHQAARERRAGPTASRASSRAASWTSPSRSTISNVMIVCPSCSRPTRVRHDRGGRRPQRPGLHALRRAADASGGGAQVSGELRQRYRDEVVPALQKEFELRQPDAGAAPHEDRRQHRPGRGADEREGASTPPSATCARSPARSRSSRAPSAPSPSSASGPATPSASR